MSPKLALVAGGTGGHLYPAIETARVWQQQTGQAPLLLTRAGADAEKVRAQGFEPVCFLSARPPQGKKDYPGYALALVRGALTARALLSQHGVTHLLGFGNYISFAAMALAPRGVKLAAHEANSVPGKANLRLLPRLSRLYLSFEDSLSRIPPAQQHKTKVTGFPVRPLENMTQAEAKAALGLPPDKPLLVVTGGSQGAKKLNEVLLQALPPPPLMVYWIVGDRDFEWVCKALPAPPPNVRLVAYEHRMPLVWRAADMALCRAGAGTLFEAWSAAVPLVLVPYPFAAENHQHTNALEWQRRFGVQVIPDGEFSAAAFQQALSLWTPFDGPALAAVHQAMLSAPPPAAAANMLDDFVGLGGKELF